mmetsp:Transcript_27879/g.39896  ORF Transcript_27879/g.39896 Transcript_27879/m.39896 type:complete len:580 (-) Transcript_27879:35-1774(-)
MPAADVHRCWQLIWWFCVVCNFLVSAATASGDNNFLVKQIRSSLTRANPTLCCATIGVRDQAVNPLEPTIRALKFWRRVAPIVVHYKFTEYWFKVAHVGDKTRRYETWEKLHSTHAPTGLKCILELRGLFVKIGQVMSSRADFVPRQYVDVFSELQDSVPPWEKDRIQQIVQQSLMESQGLQIEDVFETFDEVLGSASIGQVHKAKLTPKFGGDVVAVKVMHPNAETRFRNDFKIFRTLCKVALPGWDPILRELEMQMMTEFDYTNEGHNLLRVGKNMAKSPYANKVKVPRPALHLCSKNLLVMEYLSGKKLATSIEDKLASILGGDRLMARKVLKAKQQALFESKHSGHQKKGFLKGLNDILGESNNSMSVLEKATKARKLMSMTRDARNKLSLLLDATGHQIFNDGLYNGDPHPGNILVLECGKLGLIDYGQTRSLTKHDRLALAAVVCALGKKTVDMNEVSNAMNEFGFHSRDNNEENIAKFAALYFDSDAAGKSLGYATPQKYLQHLNSIDPMVDVPDPAVFVARTSFLFRGLGALLQQQLHTSQHWKKHAKIAIDTKGEDMQLYNLGITPIVSE